MKTYQHWINGKQVNPASEAWIDSVDPYSGDVWARIPRGNAEDAARAVAAAKEAMHRGPWSRMTATERGRVLRRIGDLLADPRNAQRLAEIESRDNGKILAEMHGQLKYLPEHWYYFAGLADKIQGSVVPVDKPDMLAMTYREPVGVVVALTAWNSPLMFFTTKCAPALAAGCSIVLKPSEFASASSLEFAAITKEAGLPDGVINVVTGLGPELGTQLVVAYVAAGLEYPINVAVGKGFQDAAKEAGVKAVVLDGKASVEKQGNAIDDLITQGVDGIAILPIDGIVAQGWVDRTAAQNIPMVSVATEIGDPQKRPIKDVYPKLAALVASDELQTGEVAGEIAAKLLPKDRVAQIAIVEGAPGYPQVWQRSKGFRQGLDAAGVKYRIVASQPTDWTPEKGKAVCQNVLQAHPDLDLFYNQADDMMIGCAKAVRAARAHAKLVGWGGSRVALNAIKAGEADGTVCVQPEKLGRLAFNALYASVTKPGMPKGKFIEVDTPPVTKANLPSCVPQW